MKREPSHPLARRIASLRLRASRLATLQGLGVVVAAVMAAAVLLGWADYLIRFQDRGVRIISSLGLLAAFAWTCYRRLAPALRWRLSDLDVAARLERRFPQLSDRLQSAVEFLGQRGDDASAGSPALRRAVIAQAAAESETLDFNAALVRGPAIRAVLLAAGVGLVAAILVAIDPSACRIALARLANPLGAAAWPQTTRLALRERVDCVAKGRTFAVEAIDARGAPLPAEVRIHYHFSVPGSAGIDECERMQWRGGALLARRENVTGPFSYWIEGGDDHSMRPIEVEVVEPPRVESLTIALFPPSYTGWPKENSERNIRALIGTRVRIVGRANKPLRSAAVCFEDGRQTPARVSPDGVSFIAGGDGDSPLRIEKSGAYWFKLVDRQGIDGGDDDRWEIRAVPDAPSTVSIERPTANVSLSSRAVLPLRIAAKDDLALRRVALVFVRSDRLNQPPGETTLYDGPARVARQPVGGLSADVRPPDMRTIDYRWDISSLELPPGSRVDFFVVARDSLLQTGKSEPRQLLILTPEELQQRVASRQELILAELTRLLALERDARTHVATAEACLKRFERLKQVDLDRLQAAELAQREVNRGLSSRGDGLPTHILALLADLENNRLDSPELRLRMNELLSQLRRLGRDELPAISRDLTAAIKSAEAAADATAPLQGAGGRQDRVIAALEAMLGRLSQWDGGRRFRRDLEQLLRDQEELTRQTADSARRTLAKDLKDLEPAELADLISLAERQLDLARRLDRLEQDGEAAARRSRQEDSSAADTIADAVEESRRLATTGQMRAAGEELQGNRIGQATGRQKQIADALRRVLDVLAFGRATREHAPGQRGLSGQQLAGLENALARLRRHEQKILEETQRIHQTRQPEGRLSRAEAANLLDAAREQRTLQAAARRLAEQLAGVEVLAAAVSAVGDGMGRAAAMLDLRESDAAVQRSEQEVVARLKWLLDQIAAARASSEAQSSSQQASTRQPGESKERNPSSSPPNPGKELSPGTNSPGEKAGQARPDTRQFQTMFERLPGWGDLPTRVREQALQAPAEEFLPKYREMIEEYYRRLAEGGREGIGD